MRTHMICKCCGAGFMAGNIAAKFCTETCRGRAYRRRRRGAPEADAALAALQTSLLETSKSPTPTTGGLEVRAWQGTDIQRRADGWVNATAMCKANGKHLPHYMANDRTQAYIAALAPVVGIPTTDLVEARQGGTPSLQGTWIHPRLAVDLARWISPAFAVWMDGWFLETINAPTPPPRPLQTFALKWNSGITIKAVDANNATVQMRDAIWHMSLIESRQQQLSLVQV